MTEKDQILALLASNQSLGTILDRLARVVCAGIPQCYCAILLKRADRWHVGAAPDFPKHWLQALRPTHSVPFAAWTEPCSFPLPSQDACWKVFGQSLEGDWPGAIIAMPITGSQGVLGTILIFGSADVLSIDEEVLSYATCMSQVAIGYRQLFDEMQFQSHHDSLTGLPTRTLFDDRLTRACAEARNMGRQLAILSVDLDHLKQTNDTMGPRVGDLLLCEAGARMRRALRPGDTVARCGGDEFSILLTDISSAQEAEEVCERLLAAIRQPLVIDGRTLNPAASIGMAVYPSDSAEAEALQRQADAALACAKQSGRDRVQPFGSRNEKLDRIRMEQLLRASLRDGHFILHYQPKVGIDGGLCGLEALVRLEHPVHGRIPPGNFISIAEESGIIVQLGAWVLDEVCRQIAEWERTGISDLCVAVNVSTLQLSRPEFSKEVLECLGRHGVSPLNIELELTESILMTGGEDSERQMQELRAIGIRFSIDDFGTGYSSLSYLHRLPVDAIKLDRSFVKAVDSDPAAKRLVQAMIGVAESLGLGVIAEGVETEAQREALVTAGCLTMQGFLFARPQSAPDLEAYLRDHSVLHAV